MEKKYSYEVMQACRQRLYLEADDTSKDDEIMSWSKRKVFTEYCLWEGLLGDWDEIIIEAIEDIFDIELD